MSIHLRFHLLLYPCLILSLTVSILSQISSSLISLSYTVTGCVHSISDFIFSYILVLYCHWLCLFYLRFHLLLYPCLTLSLAVSILSQISSSLISLSYTVTGCVYSISDFIFSYILVLHCHWLCLFYLRFHLLLYPCLILSLAVSILSQISSSLMSFSILSQISSSFISLSYILVLHCHWLCLFYLRFHLLLYPYLISLSYTVTDCVYSVSDFIFSYILVLYCHWLCLLYLRFHLLLYPCLILSLAVSILSQISSSLISLSYTFTGCVYSISDFIFSYIPLLNCHWMGVL